MMDPAKPASGSVCAHQLKLNLEAFQAEGEADSVALSFM